MSGGASWRWTALRAAAAAGLSASCAPAAVPAAVPIAEAAIQGTEHVCHRMTVDAKGGVEMCGAHAGRWTGTELLDPRGERGVWLGADGSVIDGHGGVARRASDGRIRVTIGGDEVLSATIDQQGVLVATGRMMERYSGKPVARLDVQPRTPASELLTAALFAYLLQAELVAGVLGASRCTCKR